MVSSLITETEMKEKEIYGGNKGRQGSKNMKECKRVEAKDKNTNKESNRKTEDPA